MRIYLSALYGVLYGVLLSFSTIKSFATTYTFTGNGDWGLSSNWQNGIVPPSTIPAGSIIIINGNAVDHNELYGLPADVSLTISSGASISFNLDKTFESYATIDIQGTFQDNFISQIGGTVTVEGTYTAGFQSTISSITVNNGGSLVNYGFLEVKNLTIQTGGSLINQGTINGSGTIVGPVTNSSILAPGHSPGAYNITGDYTATSTATHNFEVAGTNSGQYDLLSVSGNLNLDGTLNVSLISGFSPTSSFDLPIMTGTVNGTFSTVNLPSSFTIVYNTNNVVLRYLTTLPVKLISFDAQKKAGATELNWKVASEENVERYEIERSNDGSHFSNIGSVNASRQNNYSFVDASSLPTITFYRIKVVDADGKYSYSIIVKVADGNSSVVLKAFPSPAKNEIVLQHSSAIANSRIFINSIDGKTLMTVIPGISSQQTSLDISALSSGMYIIEYRTGTTIEKTKFVKD